jgi:hypothetical protein
MSYLHGLLDAVLDADIRRARRAQRREDADLAQLEEQSSAASAMAEDVYERAVIDEARAIVEGVSLEPPTREHLRVLVGRIPAPSQYRERPF